MKYSIFIVVFWLALSAFPTHAKQVSVDEVKNIQNHAQSGAFTGRAEWNALTYYLQGLIEGAAGYQEALSKAGKPPLFCPPKGKGYSAEELVQILDRSSPAEKNRPASLVILEAYTRKYPCK